MASINKLSIRGVRAFSPDDEEQVIEFYYPCTVIIGANGCGKTTIIEALKYAVTGSLPPGAGKGQAFVHDPKAVGQSVVKACIRLRFTNRAGTPMVVTRSMELTQKKTTLSFKALDGVLRTTDTNTGERISMSHKCAELDKQIPTLMGVSKPVLENVVFCHQEDSSWPLMEGAILKKKFDDIFDSTRYAKALDEMRSIGKEYTGIAKDLKAELSGLASHKHAANGFRNELEQLNRDVEEIEEDIAHCRGEMKQVEETIERANEITQQVEEAQDELDVQKSHQDRIRSVAENQKSMLRDNDLTSKHTLEELQNMLGDFDDKMGQERGRKDQMERQVYVLNEEIGHLKEQQVNLKVQIGKLESERDAHRQLEIDRIQKMESIAQTYSIELAVTQNTQDGSNSQERGLSASTATQDESTVGTQERDGNGYTIAENDIKLFMSGLDSKESALQDDLDQQRLDSKDTEDRLSKALATLRGEEASIQNDINKLNTKRIETREAIDKLSSNIGKSRLRKSDVDDLKRKAANAIEVRDKLMKNKRREDIPIEMKIIERDLNRLNGEIQNDQEALLWLRRNQEAQQEIALLKDQVVKDVGGLLEDVRECNDEIVKYCGEDNMKNIEGMGGDEDTGETLDKEIQAIFQKVEEEHKRLKGEVDESLREQDYLKKTISEKSALLSHNQNALEKTKRRIAILTGDGGSVRKFKKIVKEVRNFERSLGPVSTDNDISAQDLSKILEERIEENSTEGINHAAVARVISRLKKMSKPPKSEEGSQLLSCPCCRREMNTDEVRIFQNVMEGMRDSKNSPFLKTSELEEDALGKYKNWKERVAECMVGIAEYERLMQEKNDLQETVEKLDTKVKSKESELDIQRASHSKNETELLDLNDLLQSTKRFSDDAMRISRKRLEIESKETNDLNMSMSLPGDSNRDLKAAERDLQDRMDQKDQLITKMNRLNKESNGINDEIAIKNNAALNQEKLARETEAKYMAEQEASIKRDELKNQLNEINDEQSKAQAEVAPLKQKIQNKELEQKKARNLARSEEDKVAKSVNQFREDVNRLKELNERIRRYCNSDKDDELQRLLSKITNLGERIENKAQELKTLEPDLEKLVKSVSDQESHKQTIKDNIKLMHYQQQIRESEQQTSRLKEKLRNIEGAEECEIDLNRAEKRKREILDDIAHNEGRRGGIVDQIRLLKRKLKTEEYHNIEERYRVANIKHTTTVTAVKDLDKYRAALDTALQKYHSIKIQDINKIIRELWTLTYKGEDITNIELDWSKDTSARTKRSYNYRVVMTKGSSKMDMRGRCSAGQRVLACIVIRLALAETFCVNCGVIALDEPTVNLDEANKAGLAISLAQIIAHRSKQNNFQLITITHDQDFVAAMKRHLVTQSGFDMPEKFFLVSREEGVDGKYYSKIHAVDWEELT